MNLTKEFEPVWVASGTRGFTGEGYWFHLLYRIAFGLSFKGTTFVAKTTTTPSNKGNMELTADYKPRRLFPDCVAVYFNRGVMLNSVGLSGPGAQALVDTGEWQKRTQPFMLSWMPIGKTIEEQMEEAREFVRILAPQLPFFRAKVALQVNVSCPNVGADMQTIFEKAIILLGILDELKIPLIVKLNLLIQPATAVVLAQHPACAGLCVANTTPFGEVFDAQMWKTFFPNGSPLAKRGYGGGGLSGRQTYPKLLEWVREFRSLDKKTYLNACGGIDRKEKVIELFRAGANSISYATVAVLRPWRVPGINKTAHDMHW